MKLLKLLKLLEQINLNRTGKADFSSVIDKLSKSKISNCNVVSINSVTHTNFINTVLSDLVNGENRISKEQERG